MIRFVVRWVSRAVALLVVLSVLVFGITAARVWWFARGDARPASDAIVVLGAAQFDGRPSEILEARLRQAQALYLQDVAPRIVTVGGGRAGDRFTEAEAGREWLVDKEVPADDVVAVPEGRSTLASLQAATDLFEQQGWDSAVVVTDPWHALRSVEMVKDLGIEASSSPTRSGPAVRDRSTQLRYIARETAAYLFYEVVGADAESGPDAA